MNNDNGFKRPDWAPKMLSVQRITALDLARFVAMIMMVQGHVIDALVNPAAINLGEFPWNLWNFARGFTAQVFLMVSGTVQVFANKRMENGKIKPETMKRRIRIAWLLVGIGYLFMLPANKIIDMFFIDFYYWIAFCRANILQLIGISIFLALLLFKFTRSDKSLGRLALIIAISMTLISPFVHMVNWFNYLPEIVAAYFSFEHGSFFPIFPYTAFLFYGLFLGTILKKKGPDERTKFIMHWFLPVGIVLIGAGIGLKYMFHELSWNMQVRANPGVILYQIGSVLAGMSICAFIFSKTKQFTFYYAMFGKRALMVYVLHLILLYGTPWFASIGNIFAREFSPGWAIFFAVVIEIMTFSLIYLYEFLLNKYEKFRKYYLYVLGVVVVYFVLIGNIWMW